MAPQPTSGEWYEAIAAWPARSARAVRWAGLAFAALLGAVPLLRLLLPAPAATPAPVPAWRWADVASGQWPKALERHWQETSWLTVVLRSVHDETLRRLGVARATGLLGTFVYETMDGERFGTDQGLELLRRGMVVPVPGRVGHELPRPRLRIAPNLRFYLSYQDHERLRRDWFDAHGRVLVRLDGHGLRERPEVTTLPKPAGQQRVLCLGDSYTFGWGVPEELGWVRRVEDALRTAGRDLRTINCGAAGTTCADEYAAALVHRFAALAPDAVVVGLSLNDLIPSAGLAVHGKPGEQGFGDALRGRPRQGPLDLDPSVDWVGYLLALREDEGLAAGLYGDEKPFADMWSQGGPQRDLRAMAEFCRARGLPFLVVLWPFLQGLGPGRQYPFARLHDQVAADCAAAGIALVDLWPLLREVPQEDLWVTPADMHPNPRAHALVAPAIAEALRRIWPQ